MARLEAAMTALSHLPGSAVFYDGWDPEPLVPPAALGRRGTSTPIHELPRTWPVGVPRQGDERVAGPTMTGCGAFSSCLLARVVASCGAQDFGAVPCSKLWYLAGCGQGARNVA